MRALIVAVIVAALVAPALADAPATVAVIPLQADRRLQLYGQPVANELANALRTATFDVVLVDEVTDIPARAWLVVDGRLVRTGAAITIELRIRDPERAIDVARLAAKAASLAEIDRATRELSAQLVATMEQQRAALVEPVAVVPVRPIDPIHAPDRPALPARPIDRRPVARLSVIGRDVKDRSGAKLDVAALGTPAAIALAARLGYRAAHPGEVAALTITIDLLSLTAGFERDVPIGRARARVEVVDGAGLKLFDRVVRTDSVVGSRGDRVDTLVRLVAAQVTDVVAPRIRERLGSP